MATAGLELVLGALSEGGPAETGTARAMLCAALPHALAPVVVVAQPHPYQLRVLDDVRRALEDLRSAGVEAMGAAASDVKVARSMVAEAEAAMTSATAAVDKAKVMVETLKAHRDELTSKVREAESDLEATEASTQLVIDNRAQVLAELEAARAVVAAVETAETNRTSAPENDASGVLVALLEKRHAEKALIAAAPAALGIPAAARSDFDRFTVQAAMRFVGEVVTSLEETLASGAQQAANAEAERLGSWAILDDERERAAELEARIAAAEGILGDAETSRRAASADVGAKQQALSDKLIAETLAESRLKELARASDAFERLVKPPAPESWEAPTAHLAQAPAVAGEPQVSATAEEPASTQDAAMPDPQEEAQTRAGDEAMTEVTDVAAKVLEAPVRPAPENLSVGGA
mmetsp:Transcript_127538/g.366901  ORF Transcript_127538/g.366901 Transcript_127538/m.366901 type:complete len:408 (-) Transcript_127538:100-1323(-)